MAYWNATKLINIYTGTSPNDGTGDGIRDAFIKVDENFANISAQLAQANQDWYNANVALNTNLNYANIANLFVANATGTTARFTSNITGGNIIANTGLYSSGVTNLTGNTVVGNLTVTGSPFFTGQNVRVSTHIIPTSNVTYDLGSTTNFFRNIYTQGLVQVNTVTTSSDAGLLSLHANLAPGDTKDVGVFGKYYKDAANSYAFFGYQFQTGNFVYKQTATNAIAGNSVVYDGVYGNVQFGSLLLSNTTASTTTTNGALIVAGGVGISGAVNVAGNITVPTTFGNVLGNYANVRNIWNTASNITVTTGNILFSNNAYAYGYQILTTNTPGINLYTGVSTFTNNVAITSAYNSTSTTTGALVLSYGGAGIAGNIFAGGYISSTNGFLGQLFGAQNNVTSMSIGGGNTTISQSGQINSTNFQGTSLGVTNITATGTLNLTGATASGLATLGVVGNITTGNLSASFITGTFNTPAQPYITSVGILTGLNINGVLNTNGNTIHNGNLAVTGNTTLGNSAASAITITGVTTHTGNLIVNGNTWQNGNVVTVGNTVKNGNLILNGNATLGNSSTVSAITLTGVTTQTGNFFITGVTTHTGNLIVNGNTWQNGNVVTVGNTVKNGNLIVTGNVTLGNSTNTTLTITGPTVHLGSIAASSSITSAATVTALAVNSPTVGNTGAAVIGATGRFDTSVTTATLNAATIGNTGAAHIGATGRFDTSVTTATLNAATIGNATAYITGGNSRIDTAITTGALYAGTIGNTSAVLTGATLSLSGALQTASSVTASTLVSNVATGTAPLTVSSTTKVTNLNADLLDGYTADPANTASTIVVRDTNGNINVGNALIASTLASINTTTGALVVSGGVGIAGNIYLSGNVVTSSSGADTIPVGTTAQRPGVPVTGMIRFNSSLTSFEGYGGSAWASLGGVKSVDGKAYIQAETAPNAGDDVIRVFAGDSGTSTQVMWASTSNIRILPTTVASSVSSGALQVAGGAGITGNLYAGSINATPIGNATASTGTFTTLVATSSLAVTGTATLNGVALATIGGSASFSSINGTPIGNTTPSSGAFTTLTNSGVHISSGNIVAASGAASTSTTTGALVVTGGVGISGALYNGSAHISLGNIVAASGTASTDTTTGALVVTGGAGFSGSVHVGSTIEAFGNIVAGSGVISTSTTTGALTVIGGAGISGAIYNGGVHVSTGNIVAASGTASTNTTTGALVVTGGAGISGAVIAGGNIVAASGTASTSTTTGALVVTGGAGISGAINAASATVNGTVVATTLNAGTIGNISANHVGTGTYLTSLVASNINGTVSTANVALYHSITATTTNGLYYVTLSDMSAGNADILSASTLTHNPSTGNLTATGHIGTFYGTAAVTSGTITGTTTYNAGAITTTGLTVSGSIAVNSSNGTVAISNGGNNGVGNIGVAGDTFNYVFANYFSGTATQAQYADLAELYEADAEYEPGTVVVFGGNKEITVTNQFGDARVAGAISTNPAHLMNTGLEGGLPVALRGRVPVKVIGPVTKGDSLVTSTTPGYAESIEHHRDYGQAVFAKSLVTDLSEGEKVIEAVIL